MPHQIIGPIIVVSINLALAVWALATRPRDAAYRAFAALGLALVVWNVGGAICWYAGPVASTSGLNPATWTHLRATWLRLAFLGAALAPPNMLCLVLAARGRRWLARVRPGWWTPTLYVPAAVMGVMLDLGFMRSRALTNSWRRAFYDTTDAGALVVVTVSGVYMLASLLLCWPDGRAPSDERREATTLYRTIIAPWVIGVAAILAMGAVRAERAPTAALWTMVVSQAAMFQLARLGCVAVRADRQRWIRFFLIVAMVGIAALLASVAVAWLLERKVSVESALVLTVAIVGACHIYAAVLPRLESLAGKIASGRNKE